MNNKQITVGIPAYKAHNYIIRCLASIQVQSIVNSVEVVIANDYPEDNYEYIKEIFPNLSITILPCEKNTGPGLARQRVVDYCSTPWITFIDADDTFYGYTALESLYNNRENVVVVQGGFLEETLSFTTRAWDNLSCQPWVFARLYNVKFLRDNQISFSSLRASEDYEFSQKINLLLWERSDLIRTIDEIIVIWKRNESSITRSGIIDGIPQYTFDLCWIGIVRASLNIVDYISDRVSERVMLRFIFETMVSLYDTYIKCSIHSPVFMEQNLFNAKWFYNECYKKYLVPVDSKIYAKQMKVSPNLPSVDEYQEFLVSLSQMNYSGIDELYSIRSNLPQELINSAKLTGVLGEDSIL